MASPATAFPTTNSPTAASAVASATASITTESPTTATPAIRTDEEGGMGGGATKGMEEELEKEYGSAPLVVSSVARRRNSWTPAVARFPDDDSEMYPFLNSQVTMRKIKGYVNGENLVPQTTYSFIVSTNFGQKSNLVNFFVLTLQLVSYGVVISSSFDFEDQFNPYHLPANVTSYVRATQILSLVYSICVQDSTIKALYTFRNGYDEQELRRSFPDCAETSTGLKIRWYLSLSLILFLGLLAQFLTFLLIMQSSDVLSVLLNYAAVNFIATIDDRMFYLGKRGWLGQEMEKEVRAICLADDVAPNPKWYRKLAHSFALLLIFATLIILWIVIVDKQTSGRYLSKTILVEFSDGVHPSLGTFSGLYDIYYKRNQVFSSDRAVYMERASRRAHFGYCGDAAAWTFAYNISESEFDACSWAAISSPTESFDILTSVVSQWTAKKPNGMLVPMQRASISSFDCIRDINVCGSHGTCSLTRNECICESGWYGLKCNFAAPCPLLQLDARFGNTFGSAERSWSSNYEILKFGNDTALVYEHPVYVTQTNPRGQVADGSLKTFDIIFFTGRRWALAFSQEFYNPARDGDLETYLKSFHAEFSDYKVAFLSEPVTPILESPSPIGVGWFFADQVVHTTMQAATSQELSIGFLCAECDDEEHPCFYDGQCRNGTCHCTQGSTGSLCEQPPIGNGHCDVFYNKLEFSMDGGDCCRATCISSNDYICGKDETGFLDYGFFNCKSNDPLPSKEISGEPFSGTGSLVTISRNGYLLATTKKGGNVAIYDKSGAEWKERFVLKVCTTTGAVRAMEMSGGPFVSNPVVKETPFILVVSCVGSTEPLLYYCRQELEKVCIRKRLEQPQDVGGSFGFSVAISDDGGVVAVASYDFVSISRAKKGDNPGSIEWSGGANETVVPWKYLGSPAPFVPPVLNSSLSPSWNFSENVDTLMANSNQSLLVLPNLTDFSQTTRTPFIITNLTGTTNPTATPSPTISGAPTVSPTSAPTASAQLVLAASLSGNGNALAIAAVDAPDSVSVQIHYYQYNGTFWEEQGVPLEEILCSSGKFFGVKDMVQLSEDGQTLLVSGGSNMRIFYWEDESEEWVLQGDPIIPEQECSIKTLSLSPSGRVVAADLIMNKEDEMSETSGSNVWTFRWEGSGWQRREQEGRGFPVPSVDAIARLALDYSGRELGIGVAGYSADLSGRVATFEYPRTKCDEGFILYRVTMVIHPRITRWSLWSLSYEDSLIWMEGGPYFFPNFVDASDVSLAWHDMATVVEEVCMPLTKCGVFTLFPTNFGGIAIIHDGIEDLKFQNTEIFTTRVGNMSGTEWCEQYEFPPSPPAQ